MIIFEEYIEAYNFAGIFPVTMQCSLFSFAQVSQIFFVLSDCVIILNSFQIDLAEIKTEYEKKTGKTLKAEVQDELKGDLEKLLLQIIGD